MACQHLGYLNTKVSLAVIFSDYILRKMYLHNHLKELRIFYTLLQYQYFNSQCINTVHNHFKQVKTSYLVAIPMFTCSK